MELIKNCHHRPALYNEESSCGSVVLAALLNIDCQEAEMLMDLYSKKGWNGYTNVGHIKNVVIRNGIRMYKLKRVNKEKDLQLLYANKPTAMFIQLEGPWESKGWRSAYSYTHWALLVGNQVMDINNVYYEHQINRPIWVARGKWKNEIMKFLVEHTDDCTGFHIRAAYEFLEIP